MNYEKFGALKSHYTVPKKRKKVEIFQHILVDILKKILTVHCVTVLVRATSDSAQ